jgi:hypothetical protein
MITMWQSSHPGAKGGHEATGDTPTAALAKDQSSVESGRSHDTGRLGKPRKSQPEGACGSRARPAQWRQSRPIDFPLGARHPGTTTARRSERTNVAPGASRSGCQHGAHPIFGTTNPADGGMSGHCQYHVATNIHAGGRRQALTVSSQTMAGSVPGVPCPAAAVVDQRSRSGGDQYIAVAAPNSGQRLGGFAVWPELVGENGR